MTPVDLIPVQEVEALLARRREVLDADTRDTVATIIARIRAGGEAALLDISRELGDWDGRARWWHDVTDCRNAAATLDPGVRTDLEAMAARITAFARAQRACITELELAIPGGRAGHHLVPVARVGCYAPGGRFPLPSSVLMTACTARAAGAASVWVATPRPEPVMLAAAAIAGADGVLALGGAQAIAALAFGVGPFPPVDLVVGPGNRYVTAAKAALIGEVGIDGLAGPSELVVLADASADPELIAADLIAQAEHDPDALPVLVTTHPPLVEATRAAITRRLVGLPTANTALPALAAGATIVADSLDAALEAVDRIAPEHLELMVASPRAVASRVGSAGALFLGSGAGEVFGDYGAGPNHVLPTGGGARFGGGLSVLTFLRARTWLEMGDPSVLTGPVSRLARLERLEGHARAAEERAELRFTRQGEGNRVTGDG